MRKVFLVVAVGSGLGLLMTVVAATWFLQDGTPTGGPTLTYACPAPLASTDASLITSRIADLRVPASVEILDASHLRAHVAADPQAESLLRSLFDAHRLEIRRVDEAAMQSLATSALPAGVSGTTSPRPEISAATAAALAALASTTIRVGCDERHACRAWAVGPVELGSDDVADASASRDGEGATLAITLTSAARLAFARLTTSAVGARLAFLVDDHVLMVPVVQDPITGGHVSITLGERDGGYPLAAATASALRLGPLACSHWSLE